MTKESREEDSGLHDIRGLAASTKARMSARRSTQNPVVSDDDLIASSSAGWKAVALPEPAKMVSLPELAELPSAKEIKAKDKAAQKAKAAEDKAAAKAATVAPAIAPATATATDAPAAAPAASVTNIGSRIAAKQQAGGKGKTIALVGVGVAAAAGVAIYFAMNKNGDTADKSAQVAATAPAQREEYKPTAKMLPPPPPPAADTTAAAAGSAAPAEPPPVAQIAAPETPPEAPKAKGVEKKEKPHKVEIRDTSMTDNAAKADKQKAPAKEEKTGEKKDPDAGDPSFDQLLKEAGVSDKQQAKKPVLTKKSLDGNDIKTGMGAVAGKAQACYAGTQGQAKVRLTVAPSGQITKVSVTGVFAGTPVGACVEAAVKGATFPQWDGGPQSFGYTYLLAE